MRIYPVTPPARAVNAPEPAIPAPVTSSLPQYKVRARDGSEIIIPTAEVLAHKVLSGEIRPDTVIFDAGRGTWCRAAEAPLVRFIVTEASRERPELVTAWPLEDARPAPAKPIGQTELFNGGKEATAWPTVRQIDPIAGTQQSYEAASPRSAPRMVDAELPRAASPRHVHAASTEHRTAPPKPIPPVAAAEPHIEWDEWGHASVAADLLPVPAPAANRRMMSAKKRARIFASSLVGGVAATVALGLFLRGETSGSSVTITEPQTSADPPSQPYTFAENPAPTSTLPPAPITRAPAPQPPARTEQLAPATADFPKFEPPRASRPIAIPQAPVLGDAQLVGNVDLAATSTALLSLPTPPRPTRENEAAPPPVTFTQPKVSNAARVQQALERVYPIGLRELGIGGKVEMSFYINERGVVERFETKQGSGNADLDKAALEVAEVFQFTPAMRGNEAVPVWHSMQITFGKVANATPSAPTNVVAATQTGPDQPVASQFDVAPTVRNANRVRQTLDREYPIGLRTTGVGGTVELWFYVDERGQVERFQLKQSSGNSDLDRAALQVAQVFQFNPGTRGGTPAAGWIWMGVAFAPDNSTR
jgi:TonB family protein